MLLPPASLKPFRQRTNHSKSHKFRSNGTSKPNTSEPVNATEIEMHGLTGAVFLCDVAALAHEVFDDSMEWTALVPKAPLTGAERSKVVARLWANIREQFDIYTMRLLAVDRDIQVHEIIVWVSRSFGYHHLVLLCCICSRVCA